MTLSGNGVQQGALEVFRIMKFPELPQLRWWQGAGGGAGVGREDADPSSC